MLKKRESFVNSAIAAMRSAVRKAIQEQERLGLVVPVWKNGAVVFLKSSGSLLVRESAAGYGLKPRSSHTRSMRAATKTK